MAPILKKTIYTGLFIHCTTLGKVEILTDTSIGVDEHGKIAFITPQDTLESTLQDRSWNAAETQHFPPPSSSPDLPNTISFFFPGFLDTHIHASQHPNAGIFGKSTLLSWLETYTFPLEFSLSNPARAEAVYSTCIRTTLSHGTTTAAYYATISVESTNILAQQCFNLGQRAFVGRCAMDNAYFQPSYYRDASASDAIKASRESAEAILSADPSGLVKPIITPRFALSCSEESLTGLAAISSSLAIPIQTHLSENLDEIALVAETFPGHASYTALYHACNILTPRTVLAHACHLSQDEVTLVRDTESSISHCPSSNTSLGSGLCPVRELLDQGVKVGLGTDVSGGFSPSILVAAREAGAVSRLRTAPGVDTGRHLRGNNDSTDVAQKDAKEVRDRLKLTIEETLYLATRGGAQCLGLAETVGGFEVGKEWDVQHVDLGAELDADFVLKGGTVGNVQVWKGMGWEERLAKWVHQGDERNVKAVWVRGRKVV